MPSKEILPEWSRINFEPMADSESNTLTLSACDLQPKIQELVGEAGV
jgi:hypothetical protein